MDSITTGLAASSILEGTKFKIQQSIPSGSIKRGPHAIVRTADLNDGINIQRRFGEGSKPLFDRDDIAVNQTTLDARDTNNLDHERNTGCKTNKTNRRSSSTESSSPERYRHRDIKKHSSPTSGRRKTPERSGRSERPTHSHDKHNYNVKSNNTMTDKYKRSRRSKSRSPPHNANKKTVEKVPYYRDEQREKDRIRRLYGRSRSRTPPPPVANLSSSSSSTAKRRIESPSRRRRRSTSRDRHRRQSPYIHRSVRRDYRSRRSRTRSRTRSPQRRERHKHSSRSSRERDNEHKEDVNSLTTAIIPATPQIIPIPVPVPAEYAAAYTFPGWTAPQPTWPPSHHRPPATSHFAPFPMWPMMPPLRPPPHQASYGGLPPPTLAYPPMTASYRPHGPQRYPQPRHNSNNNYQTRPKKPTS
ncbi:female-specific protein transformer [Lucilia cuprina]|uniref:female-specific protein transformer n=1 Tax=Lucilia cuprina TaxID=7375 RepID=UPI001F06A2CE|nr:female-specific protein transformer [Lucilia cuprina]